MSLFSPQSFPTVCCDVSIHTKKTTNNQNDRGRKNVMEIIIKRNNQADKAAT